MKHLTLIVYFVSITNLVVAQNTGKEKVAEGQYVRMKNGQSLPGSLQSWVLWRIPTGYELEDHFRLATNPATQLLADLGPKHLSPELKQKLQNQTTATGLTIQLNSDFQGQQFTLTGEKLLDHQQVELLNCALRTDETQCRAKTDKNKVALRGSQGLFYAFPFPMLFSSFVRNRNDKVTNANVAAVNYGDTKATDATCQATNLGSESVQIGDRTFTANRFHIDLQTKAGVSLTVTVWASDAGLVLAMETPDFPGERMALVQYKKYSAF